MVDKFITISISLILFSTIFSGLYNCSSSAKIPNSPYRGLVKKKGPDLLTNFVIFTEIPIKVYVDKTVPLMESQAIPKAMQKWNQVLGCTLFEATPQKSDATILVTFKKNPPKSHPRWIGSFHYTVRNGSLSGVIEIYNTLLNMSHTYQKFGAMHELGHSLGLNHSEDPKNVMFKMINEGGKLNAPQIAFIKSFYCGESL